MKFVTVNEEDKKVNVADLMISYFEFIEYLKQGNMLMTFNWLASMSLYGYQT